MSTDVPPYYREAIAAVVEGYLTNLIAFCRTVQGDDVLINSIEQLRQEVQRIGQQAPGQPGSAPHAIEQKTVFRQGFLKVFDSDGKRLDVPENTPLSEVLPDIMKRATPASPGAKESYRLTIQRTISNTEIPLPELGVQDGDVVKLEPLSTRSSLVPLLLASPVKAHPPIRIDHSPAVLGRSDKSDINIASLLPPTSPNAISRQQARFTEENGVWTVRLHENASVTMYVNKQQLTVERPIPLTEGAMISFGVDLEKPTLSLFVRYER